MARMKTEIGDVRYNAQTQSFEALVTFHKDEGRIRVAAEYEAPITTSFDDAARGLWSEALKSIEAPKALRARLCAERDRPRRVKRMLEDALNDFTGFWTGRSAA